MNEQATQTEETPPENQEQTPGSEAPPEQSPSGQSTTETPPVGDAQQTLPADEGEQAQTETPPQTPPPGSPPVHQGDVDEQGVPWKNRFMESQRKLDKIENQLNTVLDKVESSTAKAQDKYTIEDLEAFMETEAGQTPANKNWAKGEIRRLQKEEVSNTIKAVFTEQQQAQQIEKTKADALQTTMSRYPDAFRKDAKGNFVGWDPNSPMAQRIGFHMQDPELKDNPRGLLVAAALAYSDLTEGQVQKTQQKAEKLKADVKDLQKKTLTEGAGSNPPPATKTPVDAAKEKFAGTGSIKDGAAVFKNVLKRTGRITED